MQGACRTALFEGPAGSGTSALTRIVMGKFFSKDGAEPDEDVIKHGASVLALNRFVCHETNPLCTEEQLRERFTSDTNWGRGPDEWINEGGAEGDET